MILTSSARYFSPTGNYLYDRKRLIREGKSVLLPHQRGPWEIVSFISSFRKLNASFFESLKQSLLEVISHPSVCILLPKTFLQRQNTGSEERYFIDEEAVNDFCDGAFRNLAIQMHFGKISYERSLLMHFDHVFSALHMAITLHGERTIGFVINKESELALDLTQGISFSDK